MAKTNRETLMARLNAVKEEIKSLKTKTFTYNVNRIWPGVGKINEIDSPESLVRAWINIHKGADEIHNAMSELQINPKEFGMDNFEDGKVRGYTIAEWEADLRTKRDELKDSIRLDNLYDAEELLEKNMSDDDKFNADMDVVDELLG